MLFETPALDVPFRARMHPHVDRLRERTRTWARTKGFLDTGIWTPESLEAGDYGLFTAVTYPEAAHDKVELLNDWLTWGWFVDDAVEPVKRGRNVLELKAFVARIKALMPLDGSTPPPPVGPVEEALADLWERSLAAMPDEVLRQLPGFVDDYVGAALWEMHNDIQGRVPDPVDYVEMRRKSAAGDLVATLGHWANTGAAVPVELRGLRETKTLRDIFGDVGGLHNDIVSFEKDVIREGSINNAALAVRNFFGGELQDAVNVVNDLVAARMREFQTVAAEAPAGLAPFIRTLESWMAGYFTWVDRTGRYRVSPQAPERIPLHRPSGLGAAAVLVR